MKQFQIQKLNETMAEYGWIITGVPGGAIYTVGMIDRFKHPEVMIHGLPAMLTDHLLRDAVRLIEGGHSFRTADELHDGVVRNFKVKSIVVDQSNYCDWLGQALQYHGSETAAVQLLWPDRFGLFPGNPRYDKTFDEQKRFDVRRPEYEQIHEEHMPGQVCGVCGVGL